MSKIQRELWLLLSLVVIAALLNFLVSSQRVVLCFFFLPTLYSAYFFGRRHAVLTAFASVFLVVALTAMNPVLFNRHVAAASENPWFDLAAWGGILVVSGYAMGTLYERNQKSLTELQDSYDGMMVILRHFLANEKYSNAHAYRVSLYTQKIGEAMGLDSASLEDVRIAALLQNMYGLGISSDVLLKVANLSQEDLAEGMKKSSRTVNKTKALAGTLQRAIPILMMEQNFEQVRIEHCQCTPRSPDPGTRRRLRNPDQQHRCAQNVTRPGRRSDREEFRQALRLHGCRRFRESLRAAGAERGSIARSDLSDASPPPLPLASSLSAHRVTPPTSPQRAPSHQR